MKKENINRSILGSSSVFQYLGHKQYLVICMADKQLIERKSVDSYIKSSDTALLKTETFQSHQILIKVTFQNHVFTYFDWKRELAFRWIVPLIWVPFIMWTLSICIRRSTSLVQVFLLVLIGALLWQFLEYGIHRVVFHTLPSKLSQINLANHLGKFKSEEITTSKTFSTGILYHASLG